MAIFELMHLSKPTIIRRKRVLAFANQGERGFRYVANLTGRDILRLARDKIRSTYLRSVNGGHTPHSWLSSDINSPIAAQIRREIAGNKELGEDINTFMGFRLALFLRDYSSFENNLLAIGGCSGVIVDIITMFLYRSGLLSISLGASLGIGSLLVTAGCLYSMLNYSSDDIRYASFLFDKTQTRFKTREIPGVLHAIDSRAANILTSWVHELKLQDWAKSLEIKSSR